MSKLKDLTGMKFERLKVVRRHNENAPNGNAMWVCECKCGTTCIVDGYHLRSKHTQSCGCMQKDIVVGKHKKENRYTFDGDFVVGYTTNTNKPFIVDLIDYDKIKMYTWCERDDGYIVTQINGSTVRLHRLILGLDNELIDHRNGDKTDNRRKNLRPATKQLNGINRGANSNNTLGIKGVSRLKNGKYVARIMVDGKSIHLGTFETVDEAQNARSKKEQELFGEFAFGKEEI